MSFGAEQPPEERLFQAALGHPPDERDRFVRASAGEDVALLEMVLLLLKGWEESGGDRAEATLGEGPTAWNAVAVEEPGTVIGHFRLVRTIGEGGMGTVWEAEQSRPVKRTVAIKVIKLGMDTVEVVKRFERERQTLALMNHPNIAQVYEAGATALGRPYFAMELVAGEPITVHCESAKLTLRQRLELFIDVCAGIAHAHQKGVIHRDLKPSNILVADDVPKVIDFGVAKATQESESQHSLFTKQTQLLGTPAYMSPEQAASDGLDIDTRTDVYSLGVVLYELLCGEVPFDPQRLENSGVAGIQRILTEEMPPTPSTRITNQRHGVEAQEFRCRLRGDLDWVVMKALAKERDRRYASVIALATDLRCFLDGDAVSAAPPSKAYQLRKAVHKYKVAVSAAGLVLMALAVGLFISVVQTRKANRALEGEKSARHEATMTVADLYTRNGVAAGEAGEHAVATLWFANAATRAKADPERVSANLLRSASWRREIQATVRAFDTGFRFVDHLYWNPSGNWAMIATSGGRESQVWDVANETRWFPKTKRELSQAQWDPTGDRLVASVDNETVVFAYPSGDVLHRHPGGAHAAWSPTGKYLALGGEGLVLWERASGRKRTLTNLPPISGIQFHPDGKHMILQFGDELSVVNIENPESLLFPPVPCTSTAPPLFVGTDGNAFSICVEGAVEVRNSLSGALLERFEGTGHRDTGHPVTSSLDGRFIARSNAPIIDRTRPEWQKIPVHQNSYLAFSFSPDGKVLATGSYDATIKLWSLPEGDLIGQLGHIRRPILCLAHSQDGEFLAASEDGLVRVWRTASAPPLHQDVIVDQPTQVRLSSDRKRFAASGSTHFESQVTSTCVRRFPDGRPEGARITPGGLIMDAAFGQDDRWLAVAVSTTPERSSTSAVSGSGFVQLWDYRLGKALGEPKPMPSEPRGIAVHPQGDIIAIFCAGGEGLEWDTSADKITTLFDSGREAHAHATLVNGRCRYSDSGRYLITWGTYREAHYWDRVLGKDLVEPFRGNWNAYDVDLIDDLLVAAVVSDHTVIEFYDLRRQVAEPQPIRVVDWPLRVEFDQTGERLLTAGAGKVAQLWDWRRAKPLGPALPHDDQIMAACFLEGTPWVVSGSHDATIRFWDPISGFPLRAPIQMPSGWVLTLDHAPESNALIACGHGVMLIDVNQALPKPQLSPESALLLAEIDSGAVVHSGGGLIWPRREVWLEKWQAFRRAHPEHPGHRLHP